MIASNEQLFQSVFNYATIPMVLVKADGPDFTIITRNHKHQMISRTAGNNMVGRTVTEVFKPVFEKESNDLSLLLNSLLLAHSNQETVKVPVLNFTGYGNLNGSDNGKLWQIEIVPIYGPANTVDCLLIIWYGISRIDLEQEVQDIVPVMETPLGEELAATGEQIEHGNQEREAVAEELEAVKDELVHTQEELNEIPEHQRDRLRRFLMQASAGICILDGPEFVLEFVNPSFFKLFPKRDLLSKTFLSAFPEIRELEIWNILKEVYQSGKTFQGNEWLIPLINETTLRSEDRYFNFICQARYDSHERIDGLMIFVYEVTDIVLLSLEFEENERHFRGLLNAIPQIAWTNTVDGEVNFYNEQWHSYTGIDVGKKKDGNMSEVVHPDDLKYHIEQFKTIIKSRDNGSYELRIRAAKGDYRWYLIHMQPIKDEVEEVLFWIGTATDIHELKLLQQKKDDMINIATHELKTPVASLKASMQLLHRMKHDSSERMQNLIDVAGRSADKVSGLITDLLNPDQLNEGGLPLKRTVVNLSKLVEDCCETSLTKNSYDIVITGDKHLEVICDAKRIEQVISNIVTNATKYAPESKAIAIHVEKIKNVAKLSVSDKGPGIPADKIPFLFDRYFRVGHSDQTGLGLGLYISAEIISKHDGEIGVESVEGKGSTFWFTLPLG